MGDKLTPEELAEFREIFNLVDKDGGGTISKEELGDLMETLGIDATPEEIDLMIAEVDLVCLGDAIRWEPARGGDLFPHIYAELPMHAVVGLQKRDQ